MTRLILYTKQDCCLCEEALETLEAVREEIGFDIREVDISSDRALDARYGELVPVVEIDGVKAFEYRVDAQDLRDRLAVSAKDQTANGSVGATR